MLDFLRPSEYHRPTEPCGLSRLPRTLVHTTVKPLAGGQGGLKPTLNMVVQSTLLQPGGQIMPTTLLLAHPDFKTQRHLCTVYVVYTVEVSDWHLDSQFERGWEQKNYFLSDPRREMSLFPSLWHLANFSSFLKKSWTFFRTTNFFLFGFDNNQNVHTISGF